MTDAESDRRARESIANANAAMPNPMSDREFRERVIEADEETCDEEEFAAVVLSLIAERRRRNG